jgi:hypothetical protein
MIITDIYILEVSVHSNIVLNLEEKLMKYVFGAIFLGLSTFSVASSATGKLGKVEMGQHTVISSTLHSLHQFKVNQVATPMEITITL